MGCLAASAIVVVMAAIAIWLAGPGVGHLQAWFPNAILQAMIPTALLAIAFLAMFFAGKRRAAEIARWPTVTGSIVLSRVEEFTIRRDKMKRTARGMSATRRAHMPVVEYRYAVGGKEYSSRSVWADTEVSGDMAYAQNIATRYQPGMVVMVFYDPADPKRTALEQPGKTHWLFLAAAAISLAAAAATSGLIF